LGNQQVFQSTSTFIKKYAHSGINEYQLDINLTQTELQRQLFGSHQGIDNTYFATNNSETAFWLDQTWKRIAFSRSDPNTLNIYSYGDNAGEFHFASPRSIDANDWGELYVADSESKVVNKLYYSAVTNTITALSNVNFITGLLKPVDVDYYQGSTLLHRLDDIIVVADEEDNSLKIYDYTGTYICKLTGYYYYGIKTISRPKRVSVFGYEQPYRIAFIDGGTNKLVVVRLPDNFNNWNGWLYTTSAPVKFDLPSDLTDIGIDGCYNILVPDRSKNMVHKFNKDGKYACSYSGGNDFTIPYYISNVPDNCPDPAQVWVDVALASSWESDNGIRRYLPGADIKSIEHSIHSTYYRLRFTPTDDIEYLAEIIRLQDNAIVKTFIGNAYTSIQKDIILNWEDLPTTNTNYKWKFFIKPIYNSGYGSWAVNWQIREFPFYHSYDAPIFNPTTPFLQSPNPICKSSSGTLTVNLLQGNGDLNFDWYSINEPSHINTFFMGNSCTVTYLITDNPGGDGPSWDFGCTVWNSLGSVTRTVYPILDPNCYGCPTLSFEVEGEMVEENPLLISSLDNPGIDVTDYYLINTPITPNDGEINLTIIEPQTEHTWMDQVELLEVKVNKKEYVAVTGDGEIVNYKKPNHPCTITLNDTLDVTDILSELDSNKFSFLAGDILQVERNNKHMESGGGEEDLVLGAESSGDPQKKMAGLLKFKNSQIKVIDAIKENEKDDILSFGNFYVRPNMSIICTSLGALQNGILEIELNQDIEIDYLTIVKNLKTATTRTLDLLSATHSTLGDIKESVKIEDQDYAEIYPDDVINFIFESGHGNPDKKAYILKSVGRYETDSSFVFLKGNNLTIANNEELIPRENKLFNNFPNPFNPVTQIKYSIKEDSPVSLKVYDILGNEIAVLVNSEQPAGNYTVNFDASKLSSGIYLYSISANNFYSVKKMIVLK
jgi:hypothetical protein